MELTSYYTWFRNAIALASFRYKGEDSILYQGVRSQVLSNQNRNQAILLGLHGSIAADLNEQFSISGGSEL